MSHGNSGGKLLAGIIKVNIYSLLLAIITGLNTSLIVGMISFAAYLHVIGLLPALMDFESFSEKGMLQKLLGLL